MTERPVVTTWSDVQPGERWTFESWVIDRDGGGVPDAPLVVLRECPDGLYPGPVEDGVQTHYGPSRYVPEGWECRHWDEDGYDLDDPGTKCVVQCRPPVEPDPPRTERVAWHEAWGRKLPDGDETIGYVSRHSDGSVAAFAARGGLVVTPGADGTVEVLVEDGQ